MVGVEGAVGIGAVPIKANQKQGKKLEVGTGFLVQKVQGTGTGQVQTPSLGVSVRISHGDQRRSQNE